MNRHTGLYKNGRLWWILVKPVVGERKARSTGTDDLRLANRIAIMLEELREDRSLQPWLNRAASGLVTLASLYDHRSRGKLDDLARALEAPANADPDLEPWVARWIEEHVAGRSISAGSKDDYERQIRAFIPAGEPFPRSKFTEDNLKSILNGLVDARSKLPLTGSTKRRYIAPLRLFYRYARKRVPLTENPFEEADWLPENNPARTMKWDHERTLLVLSKMHGAAKLAMTTIFGSGMELGAAQSLCGDDLGSQLVGGRGVITAHGTKTDDRRDRDIFVNKWAWDEIRWLKNRGRELLWPEFAEDDTRLRDAFYQAQVDAKLIDEPPRSKSGKRLWKKVSPHTIHDARHTYCFVRLLGLDGEPRETVKFCSNNLGHGSEQMVQQIYGKLNIGEIVRQLELEEARAAGRAEVIAK